MLSSYSTFRLPLLIQFPSPSILSLRTILQTYAYAYTDLYKVGCFLHRELPVRLAHRICELESNDLFRQSESIRHVVAWYKKSFQEIRACSAPVSPDKEGAFARVIESIYERHSHTLITMAKGAHEIRNVLKQDVESFAEHHQVQKRLDEFYMSRIGIRMVSKNAAKRK